MEQRPLRLGDIVDDYCPRERRLTNHAVVVMAGDEVQQTRCTACDAEHPYKHGKVPAKKRKDGALYDEVLAGVLKPKRAPASEAEHEAEHAAEGAVAVAVAPEPTPAPVVVAAAPVAVAPRVEPMAASEPAPVAPVGEEASEPEPAAPLWGHRQLIRAQLPRIEGQVPAARPLPDFTMRNNRYGGNGSRRHGHGQHNGFRGHGNGNGNGNGSGRGGRRH